MGRALPAMEEDRRLMPILNHLDKQYLGRDFTSSAIAGEIQAQDVDSVRLSSFSPLSASGHSLCAVTDIFFVRVSWCRAAQGAYASLHGDFAQRIETGEAHPPRWSYAVWTLPQGNGTFVGASFDLLADSVREGDAGSVQQGVRLQCSSFVRYGG